GEIVELGSAVTGFREGQRVLAVLRFGGGYAEEIVVDRDTVVALPEAMDFVTAASFPVAYGTAHFALTHRGMLQPGETLLVFDPVGGDAFDQALRAVNWQARMLIIGFAAGRIQAVPANLILVKNISVIGVVWGAQAERDPVLVSRNLAELLGWWQRGRLKPLV